MPGLSLRLGTLQCCALSALLALAILESKANAAPPNDTWDGGYDTKAQRRADFTFGVSIGLLSGSAVGFPNESAKIDVARYEASTGAGFGRGSTLWLGGALRDNFNVALGLGGTSFSGGGVQASGGMFALRIEAYPLFYLGGAWRDAGILAQCGAGWMSLEAGGESLADGGNMASLGGGVFYEGWHFGGFTAGPALEYVQQFSTSLTSHSVLLGARVAFYAGP